MLQISNLKKNFIYHICFSDLTGFGSFTHSWYDFHCWSLRFEGSDLVMSQCVEHNGNGMSIIFDSLFIATLVTLLSFHNFIFLT